MHFSTPKAMVILLLLSLLAVACLARKMEPAMLDAREKPISMLLFFWCRVFPKRRLPPCIIAKAMASGTNQD